jgi:quercetin dioxygenase-like cupin family protein
MVRATAGEEAAPMTDSTAAPIAPIALRPDEGEALWFLGGLLTVKADTASTGGRVAVIEHRMPRGGGSPLHVHSREDEWFYVLEGEVTFWVDGETHALGPGGFVYGPRGIPHTFLVSSDEARFLLVAEPSAFGDFVRAFAEPAAVREIPPPATEPPDVGALTRLAAEYGIEIVGPPGIPA